jgi:hypothetical protein
MLMETKAEYNAGEKKPILSPHQLEIILDHLSECQRAGYGQVVLEVVGGRLKFIRKNVSTYAGEDSQP